MAARGRERAARLRAIRAALLGPGVRIARSGRRDVTIFECRGVRVRVANRARHIAVHWPAPEFLAGIRARHPELDCGARCVRIRDSQYVPMHALMEACARAFAQAPPFEG
jgi:hypothetical protein